jgi:hypothetical protein
LLSSAFGTSKLAPVVPVTYEHLHTLNSILTEYHKSGELVNIDEVMFRLVFDILMESSFLVKFESQLETDSSTVNGSGSGSGSGSSRTQSPTNANRYFSAYGIWQKYMVRLVANPWLSFQFWTPEYQEAHNALLYMKSLSQCIIKQYRSKAAQRNNIWRRSEKESVSVPSSGAAFPGESTTKDKQGPPTPTPTLMDAFMSLPFKDERTRVVDLLALLHEAHAPTSGTLTWLLLEVARHPRVMHRLQGELDACIPAGAALSSQSKEEEEETKEERGTRKGGVSGFPPLSVLCALPYLTQCIKEAMRLWPVTALGPQRITLFDLDTTSNGGKKIHIPQNSEVQVCFYTMFRAGWIVEPDTFNPDRWSSDNPQLPQLKEMMMPFSLGLRSCIGQNLASIQIVLIASYLFRFFEFSLDSDPTEEYFATLQAKNVRMKVKMR